MSTSADKSRRSRRTIYIDDETADDLRTQWEKQNELKQFLGSAWQGGNYVFTTSLGTPLHPDSVSKQFSKLVKRMPVTYISLHGLRHTHATLLLATGETNPRVVSERLGHSNVAFTLQF